MDLLELQDPLKAGRLLDALLDFCLDQPLSRFLSAEHLDAHLRAALKPPQLAAYVEAHWAGLLERAEARAEAADEPIGALLPEALREAILERAGAPVRFDRKTLRAIIRQESTRHLLKSVVEASLERFVEAFKSMAPTGAAEGAGRLVSGFARRAGGGIFGGITGQIEAQLQKTIAHFVSGSLTLMLDQLAVILSTERSAQLLGESRAQAVEAAFETPQAEVVRRLKALESEQLSAGLGALSAFHLDREETREALRAELEAFLEAEGVKPLREFIDEAPLRPTIRALGAPLLVDFIGGLDVAQIAEGPADAE